MIFGAQFSLFCMLVVVLLSIIQGARSELEPSLYCPETPTYSPNGSSTYRTNLNSLFATLSNASRTKNFYNFTSGLNTSNATYGLFLCRGDVAGDLCELCVANAVKELLENCPTNKSGNFRYEKCLLRYSDQSIFSTLYRPFYVFWAFGQNVTDGDKFSQELGNMMDEIATQASNGDPSGKKFAVQERRFFFQKLYALAECTPDLSRDDCDTCLRDLISFITSCRGQRDAARIVYPSCEIMYATSKFYNSNNINVDMPPPAPPPNVTNTSPVLPNPETTSSKGGKRSSVAVIIAIVASIIVSTALLVLGFLLLLKRRSRKTSDAMTEETDENDMSTAESLQYSLSQVQAATNNFSVDNKIGGGGFGDVYKGKLPNGREIAVKRLSRTSAQGAVVFKIEILLVFKLQHRNLVQLLGFSVEGIERIIIYEFVPNGSLDYFLFGML